MEKADGLKQKILEWGAAKVGYADLSMLLPEEYMHLKTGISIAIRLSDEIISQIQKSPTHTYFHHYRTVNAFIDQVTLKIATVLQNDGYLVMPIAASQSLNIDGKTYKGVFPHKTVATRAGLGWIGKSACLITPEFGPRVRLGTVLTDWIPKYDVPMDTSQCGNCRKCVENCPALAIRGNQWEPGIPREELFDAQACSTHMHQHYQHIGRGSVCGICVKSCPMGRKIIKR
ncbi:4Fe-4S double cluster binding domain-containing protein [Geosporobacter ferrireducens]|uniref:4Fe-4S ferredoxin n=1 Tax=Geosporobacter ferrireducens TaxID=1424294 RepID=A0A1D8GD58_9FIRM|nr:4Fe-4S double cluster binding domain-containing protein [Geosporobacter ferrireducens]AOT68843.1 4Fe-4S ferredoxin [Geosporobacter ferrireducens]MTI54924.1 epoxyqueuosine reductase [Geosporobacter ferrireducens]